MQTIKKILQSKFLNVRRLAVLGIGSEFRQDDAAGLLAAEALNKGLKRASLSSKVKVFFGNTAPENLTGEIKRFKPSHLVMIDTIEMGQKPGTILVLQAQDLGAGVTFSTHKMPAGVLADYFIKSINCDVILIGIQPKSIEFGKPISSSVKGSSKEIAGAIIWSLKNR